MENIRRCEICGKETSFERHNKEKQPPEGQVCYKCGRWICDRCTNWRKSPPPICKKCEKEMKE